MVVMYHYVRDDAGLPRPGSPDMSTGIKGLTTSEFRAQLDRLCELMEPIDWPTLYAWMSRRGSIPDRSRGGRRSCGGRHSSGGRHCFLLTFDDGLADHAETVLPILEERGLRGVFFVPGVVLTSHRLLSAHAVHLLLSTLDEQTFERELLSYLAEHEDDRTDWVASVDVEAAQALYHYESPARARLKYLLTITLPVDLRIEAVDALFQRHIGSPARWARHWYMDWDDLFRMQSLGHTIGGHGFAHEPYTRLTPARRRQDLGRVAAVLREGLGPDIRPLSYPYGQFDDDTCAACCDAGFAHAFTTESRLITRGSDVFRLPRVDAIDVEAVLERELVWSSTSD